MVSWCCREPSTANDSGNDHWHVIEVVKEIIVERISDEAEREATIDLAIEIYKQTMESK
jgi:hypothetical protein